MGTTVETFPLITTFCTSANPSSEQSNLGEPLTVSPNSFSTRLRSLVLAALTRRSMARAECCFSCFDSSRASSMFVAPLMISLPMLKWLPFFTAAIRARERQSNSRSRLPRSSSFSPFPSFSTSLITSALGGGGGGGGGEGGKTY